MGYKLITKSHDIKAVKALCNALQREGIPVIYKLMGSYIAVFKIVEIK